MTLKFQPQTIVFTSDSQPTEAMAVIEHEVKVTNSKLYLVPTTGRVAVNITDARTSIHCENAFLASAVCQMLLNGNFSFNPMMRV